ncbi:MAG: energy-coupled thiamine transporter ThiT [Firmicutes bacterium]|nr:energy-coupled thiamine transporter ThiT [Bacillota bacterium]
MEKTKTRALTESAILVALSVILSFIKLADLPYGGSVTLASMLPIVIISYRHGVSWGLGSGLVYAAVEQLTGLSTLSWVTTWQSVLAVVLLDYIIAFAVSGLGGTFRNIIKNQAVALTAGSVLVCVLRYICHVITGATVWAGISIPTADALTYSLIYNATYMLPEMLIMAIIAFYLGSAIDFRSNEPVRMKRAESAKSKGGVGTLVSGLFIAAALIYDVAAVFSVIQGESGFDITQISEVDWISVIAVTAAAVIGAIIVSVATKRTPDNKKNA